MTLTELRNKADPILADFWVALKDKEDTYFAKHGKYFQLLVSPTTKVVDGVDSDFTVRKPSDEVHTVDVDVPWATKIPFQIEVHEWVGADKGYTAIVTAEVNGETYTRSRNSKNEDSGWSKVTTAPWQT
jgi:hypothetical protein